MNTEQSTDVEREHEEGPPRGVQTMAVLRWLLVALMAAAATAAFGHEAGWFEHAGEAGGAQYYCPMHPGVVLDDPGQCPICSMTLVPKPPGGAAAAEHGHGEQPGGGEYYCPMHPEVTSTDPNAQCDECGGMKLVPKPSDGSNDRGTASVPGLVPITLTSDRVQLAGLRTAPVERRQLDSELRAVATVAASEKGLGVTQVRFAGWIEKLFVEQTGQRVSKGQVLATVYSPDVLAAQEEYLNALRWAAPSGPATGAAERLGRLNEQARTRLELLGISDVEIATIERTGQPTRAIALRSTVDGYVTQKTAVEGLYVQPGMPLFQVANLSTVWALADVYEHEVARVHVGQQARMELAAFPGETFAGKVAFVAPTLDTSTRTLRVRMEFGNKDLRLKPGMYGNAFLTLPADDVLAIPREALVDTGELQYVFVAQAEGRFEPRQITIGVRTRDHVEVIKGLAQGEVVVTTANFLIDSESRLRATIEGGSQPAPDAIAQNSGTDSVAPEASGKSEAKRPRPAKAGGVCETQFDAVKHPDKYQQCKACAVHRGMGGMEQDCISAIGKPWN